LPTTQLELDPLWPCSFTLEWLGPAWASLKTFSFEHLTEADMNQLNLNTEVETMYYVKWGDLGYNESTWES
jgi:hypothetical protein